MKCWGRNGEGQLGNGITTNSLTPLLVSGLSSVAEIAAGQSHTCARLSDATVNCWGYNYSGQLGNGEDANFATPVNVVGSPFITTFTLTYAAGSSGSISGTTSQIVSLGSDGTAVTAVADTGYQFLQWSDLLTANPRTDTDVTANISVTAILPSMPTP